MKQVMSKHCDHKIKVTRFPSGYGIRVFLNGKVNQEAVDIPKGEISREIYLLLRMEDKCGNWSKMAERSRARYNEKLNKIDEWKKECEKSPSTSNKS